MDKTFLLTLNGKNFKKALTTHGRDNTIKPIKEVGITGDAEVRFDAYTLKRAMLLLKIENRYKL